MRLAPRTEVRCLTHRTGSHCNGGGLEPLEPAPVWTAESLLAATRSGFVPLLVSSEMLQGENVWRDMEDGELVGVDWRMRYYDAAA